MKISRRSSNPSHMQLAALILPAWPYALNADPDRPIARTEIVDLARNVINDTRALRAALRNSCDVLSKTIPDALAADGNDVCHAMTALLSFVAGASSRVDIIVAEAVALLNRIHAVLESIRQFYRNPQEQAKIRAGGGDALVTGLLHLGGLGAAVSYVRTLHESFDAKRAAAASVRCWLAPMAQDEFLVEYLRRHVERVVRPPLTWQQQLMWHAVAGYACLHGEAVPFEPRTNCLRFGPVLSMQEAALGYYDEPHEQRAWSSQLPLSAVAPTSLLLSEPAADTLRHKTRVVARPVELCQPGMLMAAEPSGQFLYANFESKSVGIARWKQEQTPSPQDGVVAASSIELDFSVSCIGYAASIDRYLIGTAEKSLLAATPSGFRESRFTTVLQADRFSINCIATDFDNGFAVVGPVVRVISLADVVGSENPRSPIASVPFGLGRPEKRPLLSRCIAASQRNRLLTHDASAVLLWDLARDDLPVAQVAADDFVTALGACSGSPLIAFGTEKGYVNWCDPRASNSVIRRFLCDASSTCTRAITMVRLNSSGDTIVAAVRGGGVVSCSLCHPILGESSSPPPLIFESETIVQAVSDEVGGGFLVASEDLVHFVSTGH
jgi:hypothetical protein